MRSMCRLAWSSAASTWTDAVKPIEPVTVVVQRRVKPGREQAYERWIRGVTEAALHFEGHLGMNVFRPERPDDPYVLVYKFDSGEHLDRWLDSEVRARFVKEAEELADETRVEHVSGLESWFTLPGASAVVPPPRWKMAIVTGLAVWVLAQAIGPFTHATLGFLPAPLVGLVTTAVMVVLLTWVVMPRLTRLLAGWLFVKRQGPRSVR
jgi:uncharacterized protein